MSVGIKETSEAVVGANEIGLKAVSKFKDGVQFNDFVSFYNDFVNDPQFKAVVEAAYNNYQAIPEEAGDLDVGEIIALGTIQISYVPKFIAALVA